MEQTNEVMTRFAQLDKAMTQWANYAKPIYEKYFPMPVVVRSAMMAVRDNPKLAACEIMSFVTAVLQCAQWGLLPNTTAQHAYLVPFKDKIQLIPGYKGLLYMGFRDGVITGAEVSPVRKDDIWEFERNTEQVWYRHVPKFDNGDLTTWEEGDVIHIYSALYNKLMPNRPSMNVLTIPELRQIRDAALSRIPADKQRETPWVKWPMPQALKSSIKRNIKTVPLGTTNLVEAVHLDNQSEAGEIQVPPVIEAIEGEVSSDAAAELRGELGLIPKTKTDALAEKLNGKKELEQSSWLGDIEKGEVK